MRSFKHPGLFRTFPILVLVIIALTPPNQAFAVSESVLYSFQGGADGNMPLAALTEDKNGNLYGTTYYGGLYDNAGTVFKLSPPSEPGGAWTESILWSFLGRPGDGGYPSASLIMDSSGNLYGTTEYGGAYGTPYGYGTVFKLTPPTQAGSGWSESVLWNFGFGKDGAVPTAGLIMDKNGNLYGTTYGGGSHGYGYFGGTVFELSPPSEPGGAWKESILWNFANNGVDGTDPLGALVMDESGNLYGSTLYGGVYGKFLSGGTVFKLTPPLSSSGSWIESILWNFGSGSDGRSPAGNLVLDKNGDLFGTAEYGGLYAPAGAAFKLTPPALGDGSWTESILWNFVDLFGYTVDAFNPVGLIVDSVGNLYGTSQFGGSYGNGTVYGLIPRSNHESDWIESILYDFTSPGDGQFAPGGLLADANGNLFGTNQYGGTAGFGTVYEISNLSSRTDPEIAIRQTHILFPNTPIGATSVIKFDVRNIGSGQLMGTVSRPPPPFGLSGSGDFSLVPGTSATITLTFTPSSTTQIRRNDLVTSNAVRRRSEQIHLQGTGTQ